MLKIAYKARRDIWTKECFEDPAPTPLTAHCGHFGHSTLTGVSSSRTCSSTSPGFKPYDMSKDIESVASHLCLLPITYGIGSDKSFPFDFHISGGLQTTIKLNIRDSCALHLFVSDQKFV